MGAGGQKMLQNFLESTWWTKYAKSNNIWIIWNYDINQNNLAVLRAFSNLKKKKERKSKAANTECLSKIPYRKKISNEDFNLCEEGK